ncbi:MULTISPECIES: ABC transporter ATP-binding protein [Acinetobacter calcoaceticus/baumannii complex]|uniref:ABC transporter ATP-binding protein n=1 Tax=Acinetobacter calcoaceticus/baumannii complex TaxID=909768 RepID=UPI0004525C3E|nr:MULTISPECIES: ABC transporter ATP-binding protein [Acinetobacter calcoaceticus/baumannii complex]AJB48416.1 ABC transporter ATP-binding protein [Acinetobacter nosocomialis]EXE74425.1 nickel import ATP-binding protein NikE [Acinetobacter sp. 1566109]MBJ9962542.1 ABC transporter ATP-binding protein [Acinetobacter nosocomialis]MBR7738650.1 ABC transporter ATP-binding protein [Acinetobacter nosocomialis]MBR7748816.1 ABC transporter ATP-binding protein [Acinetobacter nosocomialis]
MSEQQKNVPLLHIENLRVSFKGEDKQYIETVKGISFDIPANTTVALVGESGSGKSVTSLATMGLLSVGQSKIDEKSKIVFEGQDLLRLSRKDMRKICGKDIAMIFQEPMSSLNPVFTVGNQIAEVLGLHMGMSRKQARQRVLELLKEVGIPSPETKIDAYPNQLSGGQQQRVMIAMAIACEPKLLIADEPTTALDVTIQKQIIDLLESLRQRRQMSMLFITHDLALVGEIADQVIVMRHGEIREQGLAEQVLEQPKDVYTRALLYCRPQMSQRPYRLPVTSDFMRQEDNILVEQSFDVSEIPQRKRGLNGDEQIILEVKDLKKSFYSRKGLFGKEEFQAVKGVSFKLAKGKTLGLVGESGSGKTTVGLLLMRLHEASGGEAFIEGKDILSLTEKEFAKYQRKIQIIFQNPYASLNPRFTIGQILLEPMQIHGIGKDDAERKQIALGLLERVNLPEQAYYRYPHEFSGGQRQRIAIARCLTLKPEILICDESVSALDVSVQAQVLNLLQDLQDEFGLSYIFISHDLSVVKYISDQVMVMNHGEVVEIANSDELYAHPQHDYTKRLLQAIPQGIQHIS